MYKELAKEYTILLQEFHKKHKSKINLLIKGEQAILMYLSENNDKSITPSNISKSLYITSARVAASLNSLEDKQLITRKIDLKDRRKIVIKLTNLGVEQTLLLKKNHLNNFTYLLSKLGEEDSVDLLRIIRKMNNILEEGDLNVKTN